MLCSQGGLHSTVSGFGGLQLHPFPESSGFECTLRWQRLGGNRSDIGLRSGICGFGSICGVNVLRVGSGLIVLAGTMTRLLASKA